MYAMEAEQASIRPPPAVRRSFETLPGWELVRRGLDDRALGRETVAAMLVALASRRIASAGFAVPDAPIEDPQWRLYRLVAAEVGEGAAHARYNALRRLLVSFLRAV